MVKIAAAVGRVKAEQKVTSSVVVNTAVGRPSESSLVLVLVSSLVEVGKETLQLRSTHHCERHR